MQFHQDGCSPYLYKFAQDKKLSFEKLLAMEFNKQRDNLNINKSNYTCNEVASNGFMHCMENYYSKKLGCVLPWALVHSQNNQNMNVCKGKDKYLEFKNISMNILKPETDEELNKEGCFIPDCQQRSWSIGFKETYDLETMRHETSMESATDGFLYDIPQETLGTIFILCKDIGVGGWSRKWQFSLTLCNENVLT